MNFYVDRRTLIQLIEHLAKPRNQKGQADQWLRLIAHGAQVLVEANRIQAGTDALVLEEGSCQLHRLTLLKLLKSYRGKPNIRVIGSAKEICIERVRLPAIGYKGQGKGT